MQEARQSQFLAGDIRLAQQSLDLNRQSLALQQRQIDFNRQMTLINTAIAGTSAAVGIGKAIGDYHDQQANLIRQTEALKYQAGVDEAIQKGYSPYIEVRDRYGNIIYDEEGRAKTYRRGFDGYVMDDGTRLGDIKQNAIDAAGKAYWTMSGAATGMQSTANAFYKIEIGAQEQLMNKIFAERQAVLNQQIANAENARDLEQAIAIWSSAPGLTDDQRKAGILGSKSRIDYGILEDEICKIARTDGMDAVDRYLAGYTYPGEEGRNLTATEKKNLYAAGKEAREQLINPQQKALNEKWEKALAEVDWFDNKELNIAKAALKEQQDVFTACDNDRNYAIFMGRLYRREQELASSRGSGLSATELDRANASEMELTYKDWLAGKIGIDEAMSAMNGLDLSQAGINEKNKYYEKMLEAQDPLTARAFEEYLSFAEDIKLDQKITDDMMMHLTRTFSNNEVQHKDRAAYVESIKNREMAKYMEKAMNNPNATWSENDQKKQNAAAYNGELDPYFFPVGENGRHEMTVSGADVIKKNVINYGEKKITEAFKGTDWKILDHVVERKGDNDETGRIFFNVKNSRGEEATVIVNPEGKLEKKESGRLVPFDNEVTAGRAEIARKYEAANPEKANRVNKVVNEYKSGTIIQDPSRLEIELLEALGVSGRGLNAQEESFIEAKMRECGF